jgi:hypothetical protein
VPAIDGVLLQHAELVLERAVVAGVVPAHGPVAGSDECARVGVIVEPDPGQDGAFGWVAVDCGNVSCETRAYDTRSNIKSLRPRNWLAHASGRSGLAEARSDISRTTHPQSAQQKIRGLMV